MAKCWGQVKPFNIPPHEQGVCAKVWARISTLYIVKMIKRANAINKPLNCSLSNRRKTGIRVSNETNKSAAGITKGSGMRWLWMSKKNECKSSHLAAAV